MEKVFLDTNIFIDLVENRNNELRQFTTNSTLYISVLTLNIWVYVYKHVVPNSKFDFIFETYNIVSSNGNIAQKASMGPTDDFEDNVQLHSATEENCNLFVTKDKGLLKLGYFGKMRISNHI